MGYRTNTARLACVSLATLYACTATAQTPPAPQWDSFPGIKNYQWVGVKARYSGGYAGLRTCIRRARSKVGAEYFAALVDVTDAKGRTDESARDAQPYAAALFEDWKETRGIDAQTAILLVTGVKNNSIGVQVGQKFRNLGLDDRAIRDAIAASDFDYWVRRYDLGAGVCSVATAVDFKLVQLEREAARIAERVSKEAPALKERLTSMEGRIADASGGQGTHHTKLVSTLNEAGALIETATTAVGERPAEAGKALEKATGQTEELAENIAEYEAAMASLSAVEKELKALKHETESRFDSGWEHPQAALQKLEECTTLAAEIRDKFEAKPADARDCLRLAESEAKQGDIVAAYDAGRIPMIAFVVLLLGLLSTLAALFLRRRYSMRILQTDLDVWEARVNTASEELERLLAEYPEYFADREIWEGQAATLDASVLASAQNALLLEGNAKALLARAQELKAGANPLDFRKLDRALQILREETVQWSTGEVDPRCRARITAESYSSEAAHVPGDLADAVSDVSRGMREIESYVKRGRETSESATLAGRAASGALAHRRDLGLPTERLEARIQAVRSRTEAGVAELARDPVTGARDLAAITAELEVLEHDISVGNKLAEEANAAFTERISELRRIMRGLTDLQETEFKPSDALGALEFEVEEIIEMINDDLYQEARESAEQLREKLEELERRIAVMQEAPQILPTLINELNQRRDSFKSDSLKIRMSLQKADEDVQEAFAEELKRLAEYQNEMSRFPRRALEIQSALEQGKPLSAAASFVRTVRPIIEGLQLIADLGESSGAIEDAVFVPLPDEWEKSMMADWDPGDFARKRRPTGRF